MNKYTEYLDSDRGEAKLLLELFDQVVESKFQEAFGTAMRIRAIRDIKWELKKIDEQNK